MEVADFNFGHTYSDLEYKTFRERLRDSVVNAFTKAPTPSSSEVPVWPLERDMEAWHNLDVYVHM